MRWISTIALALLVGSMASGVEQPKRIDQNGVVGIWFDEIEMLRLYRAQRVVLSVETGEFGWFGRGL